MAARITIKGQITLPRKVRATLRLSPGDRVEFTANDHGEVVVRKRALQRERLSRARIAAQTRRRAAELLALLRGLD